MRSRLATCALVFTLALVPSLTPRSDGSSGTGDEPGLRGADPQPSVALPDIIEADGGIELGEERAWAPFDRGTMPDADRARVAGPVPRASVVTGFASINATNMSPSDTNGAGGDNHVLAAVNPDWGLFSRSGVPEIGPTHISDLFPSSPGLKFDPRVVYDPYRDHYVMIYLGYDYGPPEKGYLYVVSIPDATATDQSTWCARRFTSDLSKDGIDAWLDYPGLGFDARRIYVTGNL